MSEKTNARGKVPEYPAVNEREWYALAVASACITTVIAAFLLLWVFYGEFPGSVSERVSITGAIVTFCGAVTTFFTVAWRGLINTRQADTANAQIQEAIEQGRRVERQLQSTDSNNITSHFASAAELLADASKAKQRAGIALLRSVGLSPVGDFNREALDLLLDYLRNSSSTPHTGPTAITALHYADEIARSMKVHPGVRMFFDQVSAEGLPTNIRGAVFTNSLISNATVQSGNAFTDCRFFECTINIVGSFAGFTYFEECKIERVAIKPGNKAEFEFCDFSDCKRAAGVRHEMLDGCFYRNGNPPEPKVYAVLGRHLDVSDSDSP